MRTSFEQSNAFDSGSQLYVIWHSGFLPFVLGYAFGKNIGIIIPPDRQLVEEALKRRPAPKILICRAIRRTSWCIGGAWTPACCCWSSPSASASLPG